MNDSSMKSHNFNKRTNKRIAKSNWSMTLSKEKEKREHSLLFHHFNPFRQIKNICRKRTSNNTTIPLDKNKGKSTCLKDKSPTSNKNLMKWKSLIKLKSMIWRLNKTNTYRKLLSWNWKLLKVRWRQQKKSICTTSSKRN